MSNTENKDCIIIDQQKEAAMCTECGTKPYKIGMPDAFYELSSRIESAKAVAYYIPEALPGKLDGPSECAYNLTNAVIDLLELAMTDINRLEEQLKQVD